MSFPSPRNTHNHSAGGDVAVDVVEDCPINSAAPHAAPHAAPQTAPLSAQPQSRAVTLYRHFIASTMLALVDLTFSQIIRQRRQSGVYPRGHAPSQRLGSKSGEQKNQTMHEITDVAADDRTQRTQRTQGTQRGRIPVSSGAPTFYQGLQGMPSPEEFHGAFEFILPRCGMHDHVARYECACRAASMTARATCDTALSLDHDRADVFAAAAMPYFQALESGTPLYTLKQHLVSTLFHSVMHPEQTYDGDAGARREHAIDACLGAAPKVYTALSSLTPCAAVAIEKTLSFVSNQYATLLPHAQ